MPDLLPYRTLVWLDYRLGAIFALGLPLVLLIWAALKREQALLRLLGIYWRVASLLPITVLLLTDAKPLGYLLGAVAQLLLVASVWFWVDLNEELADLPPGGPALHGAGLALGAHGVRAAGGGPECLGLPLPGGRPAAARLRRVAGGP